MAGASGAPRRRLPKRRRDPISASRSPPRCLNRTTGRLFGRRCSLRECRSISFRRGNPTESTLTYHPMIYGAAQVRYVDAKLKIDSPADVTVVTPVVEGPVPVDWNAAMPVDIGPSDLESAPAGGPRLRRALPANAVKAKSMDGWGKDFATWVYGSQTLELLQAAQSGAVSNPGESERDFRIRLQQASRETRDAEVEQLRQKYAPKIAAAAGAASSRRSRPSTGSRSRPRRRRFRPPSRSARRCLAPCWDARRSALNARARHDGGARRGPHAQGVAGHRTREGNRRGGPAATRAARRGVAGRNRSY